MTGVEICGAVLSSLFYENSNESGDQEGLLLGSVHSHVTDTVSDSQISNVKEETFISVYAYLRCGVALSWYDSCGRLDKSKLTGLLPPDSRKDVVGWYRFRRNSRLAVSMRERAVHKGLRREFLHRSDDHFVFLLCTSEEVPNQATLSYSHVFHTFGPAGIKSLPSEILNLGDTSHNEYKIPKTPRRDGDTDVFSRSLFSLRKEFRTGEGEMRSVASLRQLRSTVQGQLQELCNKVSRTEDELGRLRSEVSHLKETLAVKRGQASREHIESRATVSAPALSVPLRQDRSRDDVAMDIYSPRQRLSGSGSSPKPRRLSNLSDFESTTRQFDLRETFDADDVSSMVAMGQDHAIPPSNQEEMPDLISFDDEMNNVENQRKEMDLGFEDNFVKTHPKPSTPKVAPASQTVAPLSPVLTPQPVAGSRIVKETANGKSHVIDDERMDTDSSDDPFSNLADLQRKQLESTLKHKTKKHQGNARSNETGDRDIAKGAHAHQPSARTTRSQVQGRTKTGQGRGTLVNFPSNTPEKPIVLDDDGQDSLKGSESPSF